MRLMTMQREMWYSLLFYLDAKNGHLPVLDLLTYPKGCKVWNGPAAAMPMTEITELRVDIFKLDLSVTS